MKIVAGIVTYNPDIDRLLKNIYSIIDQVEEIIIFDNASKNKNDIVERIVDRRITFIFSDDNKGIAYGLNEIVKMAVKTGSEWVVTLDQDSICPKDYIKDSQVMLVENTGQLVPLLYEDAAKEFLLLGNAVTDEHFQIVDKAITSASIVNIEAWKKVNGYDEYLFIDYVDYDFSMKLKKIGYNIQRNNQMVLKHRIGNSTYVKIWGKKIRIANHSSVRKYYIGRNIVIFMNRYHKDINTLFEMARLLKVLLLIIFFETDKLIKIHYYFKGIKDGIKHIVCQYRNANKIEEKGHWRK